MKNEEKLEWLMSFGDNNDLKLERDRKNNLYINGKRVVTEKRIRLRWPELVLAIIAAVSTASQALVSWLSYLS